MCGFCLEILKKTRKFLSVDIHFIKYKLINGFKHATKEARIRPVEVLIYREYHLFSDNVVLKLNFFI
jgi:hypothetical protein